MLVRRAARVRFASAEPSIICCFCQHRGLETAASTSAINDDASILPGLLPIPDPHPVTKSKPKTAATLRRRLDVTLSDTGSTKAVKTKLSRVLLIAEAKAARKALRDVANSKKKEEARAKRIEAQKTPGLELLGELFHKPKLTVEKKPKAKPAFKKSAINKIPIIKSEVISGLGSSAQDETPSKDAVADGNNILSEDLELAPVLLEMEREVPTLSHQLDRVLFNPGVCFLQDPRSRVYNFDPYLQTLMSVSDFNFDALADYITSSRDTRLEEIAKGLGKKYIGSTSSMTSVLAHFHFLLSCWRPINTDMLTQAFPVEFRSFSRIQRLPSAIILNWKDGVYAIDSDKEFDIETILSYLGRSMEKLLTQPPEEFEKYRRGSGSDNEEEIFEAKDRPEFHHYTTLGDFLMRSQIDAKDTRLPGTGTFDLKTRAVAGVRHNVQNPALGAGYQIKKATGQWESFEREYYDMIRSAFLKYSLQVRMGRMDGIFVAYHNTERIFGFQYISIDEMDMALHGAVGIGEKEFKLSLKLMNDALELATKRYPEQSLRIHFETRDAKTPFMYIAIEPVTDEEIKAIQTIKRKNVEDLMAGRPIGSTVSTEEREFANSVSNLEVEEKTLSHEHTTPDDLEVVQASASIDANISEFSTELEVDENDPALLTPENEATSITVSSDGVASGADFQAISDINTAPEVESHLNTNQVIFTETEDAVAETNLDEAKLQSSSAVTSIDGEGDGASGSSSEIDSTGAIQSATSEDGNVLDNDEEEDDDEIEEDDEDEDDDEGEDDEGEDDENENEDEDADEDADEGDDEDENDDENGDHPDKKHVRSGIMDDVSNVLDRIGSTSNSANMEALYSTLLDNIAIPPPADAIPETTISKDVYMLTLFAQNKVNDCSVLRPDYLSPNDKWTIDYTFSEVTGKLVKDRRYRQMRDRREKGLTESRDEDGKRPRFNGYAQHLQHLSKEGREWLKRMEDRDAKKSVTVWGKGSEVD